MGTAKYQQTAELLQRRIERGDYCSSSLPGAPKLAQELGLSYMTIRQAMQHLVESGAMARATNGRLVIPGDPAEAPRLKVAFIHPGDNCENKWYRAISGGAKRYGCSYRDIPFLFSDDQVIFDALDGDFDLIFFQIMPISPILLGKLIRHRDRVVSLFTDLTEYGIRRFDGLTCDAVGPLIAHLHERGCRSIDYFDTASTPHPRQAVWEKTLRKLKCRGNAYRHPVFPPKPCSTHTREILSGLIREGRLDGTDALFCNSMPAARGAIRALADHGIRVPEDMALASFGGPEDAQLNTPSITIVNTPNLNPLMDRIYEHYLGIRPDPKRLHYQIELSDVTPDEVILHGESVAQHYMTRCQ